MDQESSPQEVDALESRELELYGYESIWDYLHDHGGES